MKTAVLRIVRPIFERLAENFVERIGTILVKVRWG